jgi:hypothetical protein
VDGLKRLVRLRGWVSCSSSLLDSIVCRLDLARLDICLRISNSEKHTILAMLPSLFGLDIGGTLVKICFNQSDDQLVDPQLLKFLLNSGEHYGSTGRRDEHLSIRISPTQKLHFIIFETRRIIQAIELIRANNLTKTLGESISATGG